MLSTCVYVGMPPKKYHVVFEGREPGVYESWPECHRQVDRYSGNCHKSYKSHEDAKDNFKAYRRDFKSGEGSTKLGDGKSFGKK